MCISHKLFQYHYEGVGGWLPAVWLQLPAGLGDLPVLPGGLLHLSCCLKEEKVAGQRQRQLHSPEARYQYSTKLITFFQMLLPRTQLERFHSTICTIKNFPDIYHVFERQAPVCKIFITLETAIYCPIIPASDQGLERKLSKLCSEFCKNYSMKNFEN